MDDKEAKNIAIQTIMVNLAEAWRKIQENENYTEKQKEIIISNIHIYADKMAKSIGEEYFTL